MAAPLARIARRWIQNAPTCETRMERAQELFNKDRPIINLAGENSIQAYRADRFEFPSEPCDVSLGMVSPQGLLNAVVK